MPAKTADRPETRGRPTLYEGIRMRSRLEAAYAAYLDGHGIPWEYEPECFAGPEGQWLPDFRAGRGERADYVELKPMELLDFRPPETSDDRHARLDKILKRMTIAWHSAPEAVLRLIFFDFERAEPHMTVSCRGRGPWFVLLPGSLMYQALWPGMGQWEALPPANPHVAAEVLMASEELLPPVPPVPEETQP